ncbi:MAG: rRNA maturation RNase YbeY [Bacteroidales bacterium]
MGLNFLQKECTFQLTEKNKHRSWIKDVILRHGYSPGSISFIFSSDPAILEINNSFLNHNYVTDVITFDYSEKGLVSGDVFIGVDEVKRNAQLYEVEFPSELRRVMIHGILHLMGFDDGTEEQRAGMRHSEDEALGLWS